MQARKLGQLRSTFGSPEAKQGSCALGDGYQPFCSPLEDLLDPRKAERRFAFSVLRSRNPGLESSQILSLLSAVAETRLDVHNGASATGVGTTNAAVRAGIVDLLGIAIESGAITQSVNGSALTLQANALSLERFATNQDVFAVCPGGTLSCENGYEQFLRNLSASATMSLTSSTSQSVSGTVSGMPGTQTSQLQTNAAKLTALTVRFQAFNSLDLRSDRYLKAWKAAFSSELVARAKSLNAESAKTFAFDSNEIAKPVFRTWFTKAEARDLLAGKIPDTFAPGGMAIAHQLITAWAESDD